jgi:hypothetical protein
VPFTPLDPPELRGRCEVLAARLLEAAGRGHGTAADTAGLAGR